MKLTELIENAPTHAPRERRPHIAQELLELRGVPGLLSDDLVDEATRHLLPWARECAVGRTEVHIG